MVFFSIFARVFIGENVSKNHFRVKKTHQNESMFFCSLWLAFHKWQISNQKSEHFIFVHVLNSYFHFTITAGLPLPSPPASKRERKKSQMNNKATKLIVIPCDLTVFG